MLGLANEAKNLRARLAEIEKTSKTKPQKVWVKWRTEDMKVVA